MKFGLEKEFFLLDAESNPQLVPKDLSSDECGWLVEARGKPSSDPIESVFSLKASIYQEQQRLDKYNQKNDKSLQLSDQPVMKISRQLRTNAQRSYTKGLISYQNLYGHETHRNSIQDGVHITFSKAAAMTCDCRKYHEYYTNFDWPRIFKVLDQNFAEEIKASKRNPGFYELKNLGLIEYRSLPANVDLDKVIQVLQEINRNF